MKLDGTRLKTARLQRGLNQTQVANKCKLTTVTISNAEKEKDIYPATAKIICQFLGLDLADVMLPIIRDEDGDGDAA